MKRIVFFLFTAIPFTCIFSCKVKTADTTVAKASDTLIYSPSYDDKDSPLQVTEISVLGIASSQKILVHAILRNEGTETLSVDPGLLELTCMNETRSSPVYPNTDITQLDPDETASVDFTFEPVKSRYLFQQSGLRGDLDRKYTLFIGALNADNTPIRKQIILDTDSIILNKAISRYGLTTQVTPFILSEISDQATNGMKTTPALLANGHKGLQVTDNEILNKGLWLKFATLHRNDTLFMKIRMVNQTSSEIAIPVYALTLTSLNQVIEPVELPENPNIKIKNGSREELNLKFPVGILNSYSLDLSGITVEGTQTSVINYSVTFKPMSLTEQP
jgi:hypothetical protein